MKVTNCHDRLLKVFDFTLNGIRIETHSLVKVETPNTQFEKVRVSHVTYKKSNSLRIFGLNRRNF